MAGPKSEEFWRTAAAYGRLSGIEAWREAKARHLGVPLGHESLGKSPKPRRIRYQFSRTKRRGWITVDNGLNKKFGEIMQATGPAIAKSFDDELGALALHVLKRWPVMSGVSQQTIDLNYRVKSDGTFTGTLVVRAPYANYIKGAPAQKLIWSKVSAIRRRMGKDLIRHLAKA